MQIKSIELNSRELPKRFVVYLSSDELNFIQEHSADFSAEPLKSVESAKGLRLKLSATLAAQIARFTGSLSSATTPSVSDVSGEIYDSLASIFNTFYEEGYEEAL